MTSSLFDPQVFLEQEVVGESATKASPVPLGRYEMVVAKAPTFKQIQPGAGDDWEAFVIMEVDCTIDGKALDGTGRPIKETTGRDVNYARYSARLDRTESGALDMGQGKNIGLGRLRAAVGQNDPNKPWKMAMLLNARFSGEVKHRADKKDSTRIYAEVDNPLPL